MFGKDKDLSDEEYFNKYGYNKPIGGLGPLVEMTTIGPVADFSGVEHLAKGTFGNGGVRANVGLKNLKTEKRALDLAKSFDEEIKRDKNKRAIRWLFYVFDQHRHTVIEHDCYAEVVTEVRWSFAPAFSFPGKGICRRVKKEYK